MSGLGLHLQRLAQEFADKYDLHQARRLLASLSPYDHLHRIFRLCVAHIYRNIRKSRVPESVRILMRGLVCMEHLDWDRTVAKIKDTGGGSSSRYAVCFQAIPLSSPVEDWVYDKERSNFAFQAMCWEKSFMPEDVWRSGDRTSNLIETAHADINKV